MRPKILRLYSNNRERARKKNKTTNEPVEIAKRWKHLANNSKMQLNKIQFSY